MYKFHQTAASKLQEYFKTGLNSLELEYMNSLSPHNRTKVDTPKKIMYLATSYSKIVDVIAPGDGLDQLKREVELYNMDDNIKEINKNQSFNSYWGEVSMLTEGEEEWTVYEYLPRFARVLGTPFNSGSEMERGFSRQSDIVRDPKRNSMSHETLDSHMQIRYGMESMEAKSKCDTCQRKVVISEKDEDLLTEQEKREERRAKMNKQKVSMISLSLKRKRVTKKVEMILLSLKRKRVTKTVCQ